MVIRIDVLLGILTVAVVNVLTVWYGSACVITPPLLLTTIIMTAIVGASSFFRYTVNSPVELEACNAAGAISKVREGPP